MTKLKKKKTTSTFERFIKSKTPAQRKAYEEGYRDFLLS